MTDISRILKFGSLSGLGWLLDFTMLISLVGLFDAPTVAANILSSCTAAIGVFLASRSFIFTPAAGGLGIRVALYFAYTLVLIGIATYATALIVEFMNALALRQHLHPGAAVLAGTAKILVTPPLLILNFLMSRHTSERQLQA